MRPTYNVIRTLFSKCLILGALLSFPIFGWGQGLETFENHNLSGTSYVDGSFVGNNGITWNYYQVTGEQSYPIENKGILLRRSDAPSRIVSSSIPGGIGNFSIQMRKAFTGTGDRQIELFVNGTSQGTSITFGGASGADATIHTFIVNNINISGNVVIEIRHITGGTSNRQLVIDNLSWTSYTPVESTIVVSPLSLTNLNYELGSGPSAEQSFNVSGSNLTANISIVPPTNYEISTGAGGSFVATNPITLTQTGGSVASTPIYVRLKAGLAVGDYNGENITLNSTGADQKTVTCSGSVVTPDRINIAVGDTRTENFDGIGTDAAATLPTGWRVDKSTTVRQVGSFAAAGKMTEQRGGNSLSSSAGNGIYNYGAGDAATATDRAIGGLSSSSATMSMNAYMRLYNNGTEAIDHFVISYDVEKYRQGSNGAGFQIQMYYSTDGAIWISAGSDFLTSFPPDADNNGYSTAPGVWIYVTNKMLSQSIAPGESLYLAWNYSVSSGTTTSNAQALGIDNVSVSANEETAVTPPSLVVSTTTLSGFNYEFGSGPSAEQSFNVSGSNLTANISIVPPTNYEISTGTGGSFVATNPITLTQTGGSVASTPIYVRLKAGLAVGDYNGENITLNSTGADQKTVTCSGSVSPVIDVVISQVYGGGGNSGADYTHDFIELFNRGASSVNLSGWSVQYASATGTSWSNRTNLPDFDLAPGQYFLIQQVAGTGGTMPLPTPDATGTITMAASNGKVALVNSTTELTGSCPTEAQIIDFVGYGSANCFEGSGAAPALSNTTGAIRRSNGCTDTDDNAADFEVDTPYPRNSSSPFYNCALDQVATPVFVPAGGVLYVSQNIEITTTTADAAIYYTTDGTTPDNNSTPYTVPVTVSTNTTLKAIAYKAGMNPSKVATAQYSFPEDMANIAALRAGLTDGTKYRLTGEAIVTLVGHITTTPADHKQIFIQDATGAILIHDANSGVIATDYVYGDGILNLVGTLSVYQNMLQFVPLNDPGKNTTGNSIVPAVITLDDLEPGENQAELVTVYATTFAGGGSGNFAYGVNYNISDASGNGVVRTQYNDLDILGDPVPVGAHITGVILQYINTMQLVPINQNGLFKSFTDFILQPQAIEVFFGTPYFIAFAKLPKKTNLTDNFGNVYEVDIINWVIEDYDPEVPGQYIATGEVVLPPWMAQAPLKNQVTYVSTTVTVLEEPIPLPLSQWVLYIAMAAMIIAALFFLRRRLVRS